MVAVRGSPRTSGANCNATSAAVAAAAAPAKHKEVSSFKVFMEFVEDRPGYVNAAGILSSECYQKWIVSRRKHPLKPQEAFRRALTAHCRGVDGRRPFPEKVEASLLVELRKKQRWKCFEDYNDGCGKIGIQGFPSLGYHERIMKDKKRSLIEAQSVQAREFKRSRMNSSYNVSATYPPSLPVVEAPEIENNAAAYNRRWSSNMDMFDLKKNAVYSNYLKANAMKHEQSTQKYEFDVLIEEIIDPEIRTKLEYNFTDNNALTPLTPFQKTCSYEDTRFDDNSDLSFLIDQFLL